MEDDEFQLSITEKIEQLSDRLDKTRKNSFRMFILLIIFDLFIFSYLTDTLLILLYILIASILFGISFLLLSNKNFDINSLNKKNE